MAKNVLGISTSPRRNGNSDLLLKKALAGAESSGGIIEYINLNDINLNPCLACNSCFKTGRCVIKDDYHDLLEKIINADCLIFATPVFFMNVCAQAKILIDRGQCLWAKKYILNKNTQPDQQNHRAMIIAIGGSKSKNQFESIRWTLKTYFDCLNLKYVSGLFIGKVDELGAIEKHPTAFSEAYKLGAMLADFNIPLSDKSINIEIINKEDN